MKHIFFAISLFILSAQSLHAQKFTLSGTVRDAKNGETAIGTIIRVQELSGVGARSNEYGFFSLTLPGGSYHLVVSSIGFKTDTIQIDLKENQSININLSDKVKEIKEVFISSKKQQNNITNAQIGVEKLEIREINKIPVIFGERDILKTIQLLPGIKSAGEGQSGLNVRGGATDQNLILLDEAPVYSASHLLGFFSTFNSDAIKDLSVYKGTQPAQYGGRLSSVLDIRMKEGNKKDFNVAGSIGLISSKLSVEGPIVKDKSSFIIAGRRTYADVFLNFAPDTNLRKNTLYFYDLNLKTNYKIGKKDALFLSGYFGRDVLGFGNVFGINWGNSTATLRWNHIINDKLFSNTSFIYSNYDYKIKISSGTTDFSINSRIRDFNLKEEIQFFPDANNSWRFGINAIFHNIKPGEVISNNEISVLNRALENRYSLDNAVYAMNDWKASEKLNINFGLRISAFSVMGDGTFATLNGYGDSLNADQPEKSIASTTSWQTAEVLKTYINPEPRINASYIINGTSSIKLGYARNTQNLHLLQNSTAGNPVDKWISSNNNIKAEIADQFSLGFFKNTNNDKYEWSVETYFKWMQNQIDYKNGANIFAFTDYIETQLLSGVGRAYGAEFLVKKKTGKLTGWVAYTLSRTEKKIVGINNSEWYAARQDRTHDITVVAMYEVGPKINLSSTFVYSTGLAVTFPVGTYTSDGLTVNDYASRNQNRFPSNHRLDIGANFIIKQKKRYTSEINVSIYNVYGRENTYSLDFKQSETNPNKIDAVQTALFRQVPSISWNFKF
ncbi:MAG: TonB-dependent receptor [Bacteroidetes bacterium]|nr:TonB-dependent receptor [Bacteroidota bacterium]